MNNTFLSLFSTPLWATQIPNSTALNEQLFNIRNNFKQGIDYFSADTIATEQLKEHIMEFINTSFMSYYETTESFRDNIILSGRQHTILPNKVETPHHHLGAYLVGVYYVKVPLFSGDILLHDPRGSVLWEDDTRCSLKSDKTDISIAKEGILSPSLYRPFHRITPESGLLLLFPGYVTHQVEPNLSNEIRISIAIDIKLKFMRNPYGSLIFKNQGVENV